MSNYTGDPDVNLVLNNTGGPGGVATVKSGGTTYFKVDETGIVTLSEKLLRVGTHVIDVGAGGPASDMLYLEQGATSRIEFSRDGANTRARMKASTAGDVMRIEGDVVSLNTPNATGDITRFQSNGNGRLTVNWDGTSTTLKCDDFMVIHYSATTVGTRDLSFKHTDAGGTVRLTARIGETGVFDFCDGTNSNIEATLVPNDGAGAANCTLDLGKIGATRGVLTVQRDNTGAALRPGVVHFGTQDNVNGRDLWVYAFYDGAAPAGQRDQLRCHTADPGATNVGKIIVSF